MESHIIKYEGNYIHALAVKDWVEMKPESAMLAASCLQSQIKSLRQGIEMSLPNLESI